MMMLSQVFGINCNQLDIDLPGIFFGIFFNKIILRDAVSVILRPRYATTGP